MVQLPSDDNGRLAIVHAQVQTDKGVFDGIGDASPDNVGRMIVMHTVRMAETRAKARALRDAINVGVTAFEELGGPDDDENGSNGHAKAPTYSPSPRQAPALPTTINEHGEVMATQEQRNKVSKLSAASGQECPDLARMTKSDADRLIPDLVKAANSRANALTRDRQRSSDDQRQ